ncbi:phage/plasmid primase, P4 family [Chloroflexota bacterium]
MERNMEEIMVSLSPEGQAFFGNRSQPNPSQASDMIEATIEQPCEDLNLTDMGNARRLVLKHGENLRYCWENKEWLVWNGLVWEPGSNAKVVEMAKDTVRNMYLEAYESEDPGKRNELASHARKSESNHRIKSMIELAKSDPAIVVKAHELNTNPMLLNCQNGNLDLRTGILLPHNKDHLITKIVPVAFNPEATCPNWERHLRRITANDDDLISYLQRVFGYCLTGLNKEQVFFICWGPSKTGKSVTQRTMRWLLGDYGATTSSATLLSKKNETHSDLARIVGSRMVEAVETEEGQRLNAPMIKAITGNDRIAARFLYCENTEFEPTFKIFLATNDKPIVRGEDSAIWERLKLIPFTQYIPPEERERLRLRTSRTI